MTHLSVNDTDQSLYPSPNDFKDCEINRESTEKEAKIGCLITHGKYI